MTIDLAVLRTEILTDPAGIGYPPWVEDGTAADVAKQIAGLLNADRQVPGFRRTAVPAALVRSILDPVELASLSTASLAILQLYLSGDILVDFDDDTIEEILRITFPPASTTRANLVNLAQRSTRAWELFGQSSTVTWNRHVLPALRMS